MLELIKDYVRISNNCLLEDKTDVYEFDCIIPDTLPDMQKVLAVDAHAESDSVSKTSGGINLYFKINYKILYLSDPESKIKSFSAFSDHSLKIPVSAVGDDDIIKVVYNVENVDTTFINSRKISVKTTVHTDVLQKCATEIGVCTGISGIDDVQLQKSTIELNTVSEVISTSFDVDEEIALSIGKAPYREVLRSDARLSDVTYSLIGDKLQLKGNLIICTLYTADDMTESFQIIENEVPFSHSVEVENIGENISWQCDCFLKSFNAEAIADPDGELRLLRIVANIAVEGDAYSVYQQEYITDAYSLSQSFDLNSASVPCMLASDSISGQFVIRDSAVKPEDLPEISQIVNVTSCPGQYKCTSENGKFTISGSILCNVLYLSYSEECPIASFSSQIPFVQSIDCIECSDDLSAFVSVLINHISFNIMSPAEIEMRISVNIKGLAVKNCIFKNIIEISQSDNPLKESNCDKPSILLYVVQPNDSLWKIAKKYNAPIELLRDINQIKTPDLIYTGQKLLIPG